MPCEFKITRRVEFSETDQAGIMHFSNFFRFMETAEHAFFRSLGLSVDLTKSGHRLGLPRVHAECDYAAPLCFEDEVLVHLLVEKKSTRTLTYQFRFTNLSQAPPREAARGRLVVVCVRRKKDGALQSASLPKLVLERIQEAPPALLAGTVASAPPSRSTKRRRLAGKPSKSQPHP